MERSSQTVIDHLSTTEDTEDTEVYDQAFLRVLGVLRGGELKHPCRRPPYLLL
jgi:hypothetical protein